MRQTLAGDFAKITEQLFETLSAWRIEADSAAKDRLWQVVVILHEMHRDAFRRLSDHMAAETEEARPISQTTVKRHADWRATADQFKQYDHAMVSRGSCNVAPQISQAHGVRNLLIVARCPRYAP